eukprot:6023385-Pyramimonas_sp.AAC.1
MTVQGPLHGHFPTTPDVLAYAVLPVAVRLSLGGTKGPGSAGYNVRQRESQAVRYCTVDVFSHVVQAMWCTLAMWRECVMGELCGASCVAVSYTHLTLPTILLV